MFQNRTTKTVFLFILFGAGSEYFLWRTGANLVFLSLISPALALAHLLESRFPVFKNLSPLQNELFLVFPFTLLYFGLAGYWVRQIFRESGFQKYFLLISLTAFLVILHWQALGYINALVYGK